MLAPLVGLGLVCLGLSAPGLAKPPTKPVKPPDPVLPAPVAMETGANPLVGVITAQRPAPADWYFVLDTAGEMLPIAQAARAEIARLVEGIPEGDRISVVAMHTRPTEALPRARIDSVNRKTLSEKITTIDLTSAKDVDLGGALSWTVHHLTQTDAASLSFLVIVSPFCHSPSIASDFDSGGRGCRPIRGLDKIASTFAQSRGDRLLATTLIQVAPSTGVVDPVGVAAVQKVFPGATLVDGAVQPVSTWAKDFRQRLELQRVLPLARRDAETLVLAVTVSEQPTTTNPVANITLASGMKYLGLQLTDVTINGVAREQAELAPTASYPVQLDLPPVPMRILPAEEVLEIPIVVHATGHLKPADGLAAVGIPPDRADLTATTTVRLTRRIGPTWVQATVLAGLTVAFVAMGVLLARVRTRRVSLEGQFSYRRVGQARRGLDVAGRAVAPICLGPDDSLIVGDAAQAVVILRMTKTSLGAEAEVDVRRAGVQINSKPAEPGVHAVRVGATSVQFDDFRLTWE